MTVESLREIVRKVARELHSQGLTAGAARLVAAADLESVAAEEVLVMREALVLTRPDWSGRGMSVAAEATRAMNEAKRLAIDM